MLKELCDTAATNAILRYSSTKGILVKDIRGEMIKEIVIGRDDFNQALIALKSYSNNDE
jgi:hypothetical protein